MHLETVQKRKAAVKAAKALRDHMNDTHAFLKRRGGESAKYVMEIGRVEAAIQILESIQIGKAIKAKTGATKKAFEG